MLHAVSVEPGLQEQGRFCSCLRVLADELDVLIAWRLVQNAESLPKLDIRHSELKENASLFWLYEEGRLSSSDVRRN